MMRVTGESVSVTKRCVPLEDCLSTGCTYVKHEEYKVRTRVASLCETRQLVHTEHPWFLPEMCREPQNHSSRGVGCEKWDGYMHYCVS